MAEWYYWNRIKKNLKNTKSLKSMLQSPQNKVIVSVKSKYIKDFGDLTKRISIEDNTSVHLEDLVNIVGTVESLPVSISDEGHYKDYSLEGINVGDTVLFHSALFMTYTKKTGRRRNNPP
jgi:hypothetical protein